MGLPKKCLKFTNISFSLKKMEVDTFVYLNCPISVCLNQT